VVPDVGANVLEVGTATNQLLIGIDVGVDVCALEPFDCSTDVFSPNVSAESVAINIWGLAAYSSTQTIIPAVSVSVLVVDVDVVSWTPASTIKYQTGLTIEELTGTLSDSVELDGEEPLDKDYFNVD
jgi:hypothetical protein